MLQKKTYKKSNTFIFCGFFSLFRPMVKHVESEVFHFSKSTRNFNPPSLDLSLLKGPILQPKDM